jgi:hypothetical protein
MRKPKGKPEIMFWVGAELAAFLSTVQDVDERTLYRTAAQPECASASCSACAGATSTSSAG